MSGMSGVRWRATKHKQLHMTSWALQDWSSYCLATSAAAHAVHKPGHIAFASRRAMRTV